MILNSGAIFEEKPIFCLINDKNLENFAPSTKKPKKFAIDWYLLSKVYNVWSKKVQTSYNSWHRGIQHLAMRNLTNFHQNTWKCQNWSFHGILLTKIEKKWAKTLQRSYRWWYWRMIKNRKRNWLAI